MSSTQQTLDLGARDMSQFGMSLPASTHLCVSILPPELHKRISSSTAGF